MGIKNIELLGGALIRMRDKYIEEYEKAVEDAKVKEQKAKGSFISTRLKEELDAIQEEKEKRISDLRLECLETVGTFAQAVRDEERKRVNTGTMEHYAFSELEFISKMDVSPEEFSALADKYGKNGYWAKKALSVIAERNGIPYALGLSVDEKLGIVKELVDGFGEFVTIFNGRGNTPMTEGAAHAFAAVSNDVINRGCSMFQAGDAYSTLNDERSAEAASELIRSLDSYSAGMKLRNYVQNCGAGAKNALLLRLVGDGNVKDQVFALAGINPDEIRATIIERTNNYQASGQTLAKLKHSDDIETDMQEALANDPFGYLSGMIASEARSNKAIKEAYETISGEEVEENASN